MIIKALILLVNGIISLIPFEIPSFPPELATYIDTFQGYIVSAVGFVKLFLPWSYVVLLLKIVIAIELSMFLYKFVMWVLKKIPMLGIGD